MGIRDSYISFCEFVQKFPGEKVFGPYRFLPFFFFSGAALEYAMIHWRPNGVNFCKRTKPDDTFKAKKAQEVAVRKWEKWKEIEKLIK